MSQGINEQTANAQIAVEKQQAALQRQNAEAAAARRQQEAEADQARQRQEAQRKDFAAFLGAYPGVKTTEIPKEVWEKVAQGESLVSAYTMHRNRQLEAELAAERQNRKNQQRTTGSLSDPAGGDRQDDIDRWWNEDD
jgi:precorrin-6B methylase 2